MTFIANQPSHTRGNIGCMQNSSFDYPPPSLESDELLVALEEEDDKSTIAELLEKFNVHRTTIAKRIRPKIM